MHTLFFVFYSPSTILKKNGYVYNVLRHRALFLTFLFSENTATPLFPHSSAIISDWHCRCSGQKVMQDT